jgi:drug/metabolite transporter (DMT)-like permease
VTGAAARRAASPAWVVPLVCLLGAGSLLGVSTTLAKLAPRFGLAPLPFVAWSVTGAAIALLAINAARHIRLRKDRSSIRYAMMAGFVTIVAPHLLVFAAVPHAGAAFVSLAIAFPPLFTYLGALAMRMERFDRMRAAGVILALAGAAWLAVLKLAAPDAPVGWTLAALCIPLILATGNIYRTLHWPRGARPDELAAPMMAMAAAMMLAGGALIPGLSLAVPLDRPEPLALIAGQATVFAVQYLLHFVLQQRGGPVYLSLLGSVGAVVGVPLAVLLLGEQVPRGLAPSAVLIAGGITLLTLAIGRGRTRGAS